MPLLSMSPIAKRDEHGDEESAHATSFDADTQIFKLEQIFTTTMSMCTSGRCIKQQTTGKAACGFL